jgi:chorismate mutase
MEKQLASLAEILEAVVIDVKALKEKSAEFDVDINTLTKTLLALSEDRAKLVQELAEQKQANETQSSVLQKHLSDSTGAFNQLQASHNRAISSAKDMDREHNKNMLDNTKTLDLQLADAKTLHDAAKKFNEKQDKLHLRLETAESLVHELIEDLRSTKSRIGVA